MERTLVRRDGIDLLVNNKLLEGLGGGRGAVQGLVAELRNGRRLVGQRLGDTELDQRGRAKGPRITEDVLLLAVEEAKLGRGGLGGDDRNGGLLLSVLRSGKFYHAYVRSTPSRQAHRNRSMCCCRR